MSAGSIAGWLRQSYDKLCAVVILVALLLSVLWLAVHANLLAARQRAFDESLQRLRPAHEGVAPPDLGLFETARRELEQPFHLAEGGRRILTPELRVACVKCGRPIPYDAVKCPFPRCAAEQPADVTDPEDKYRAWARQYGLNLRDPGNALEDADGDGFTNREEFEYGTNPTDPKDFPPPVMKLLVEDIRPIPFALVFKGVNRMAGKTYFQINLRAGDRTYFAELGKEVEGFEVFSHEDKGVDGKPVLTLRRNGRLIRLIQDHIVPHDEYEVALRVDLDNTRRETRVGGKFDLRGVEYEVKGVDTVGRRVLIGDPIRRKDVWIGRARGEEKPGG